MERLAKYERELLELPDTIAEASHELAEAKQILRRLKELKKIHYQTIVESFNGDHPTYRAKELALLSPAWSEYLNIMLGAEGDVAKLEIEISKLKNRYGALRTAISLGKSQIDLR